MADVAGQQAACQRLDTPYTFLLNLSNSQQNQSSRVVKVGARPSVQTAYKCNSQFSVHPATRRFNLILTANQI